MTRPLPRRKSTILKRRRCRTVNVTLESLPMQTRRQLLQHAAVVAAFAALGPLSAVSARAAQTLLTRPIPSSGEQLPVIGLGTSRTHDVRMNDPQMEALQEVLRILVEGGAKLIDTAPSYGRAEAVSGELVARQGAR